MNIQKRLSNASDLYGGSFFTNSTMAYEGIRKSQAVTGNSSEITMPNNLFYTKVVEQAKMIYNLQQQLARLRKITNQKNSSFKSTDEKQAVNDHQLQKVVVYEPGEVVSNDEEKRPRILVYGHSALDKAEIVQIIKDKLSASYKIALKDKDIKVVVSDQKTELKNLAPVESLKRGSYDFFMAGPHPHSIKGKNIKHSWKTFLELKGVATGVFESYHKKISKELLQEFAAMVGDTLYENDLKQVA